MQQTPLRLSQALWSAFRAAKPTCKHAPRPLRCNSIVPNHSQRWAPQRSKIFIQARFYSDSKSEIDRKTEEAKSRIDESLNARADAAAQPEQKLKDPRHETIVHTIPEASSIVYTSRHDGRRQTDPSASPKQSQQIDKSLPSDFSSRYSHLRKQFTHFMDHFQTHVFTASQRLNDLTGYSGIEALKKEIESLETEVQHSRRSVKEARNKYSEAIAMRSTTQREVNDLLHRKHTWTPTDLERFTSLYRSDHANEQAETVAQKDVGDAEARYEEASTKLAKSILARYHEEQIWSDKIRQMSTWGTWGLMGLNVLLFVIFQIAIEPWRRRRLVKGFEEKVELALKERDEDMFGARTAAAPVVQPNQSTAAAIANLSQEQKAEAVADNIAEQIVDAISGASDEAIEGAASAPPSTSTTPPIQPPSTSEIEAAAETVTSQDLAAEQLGRGSSPDSSIPIDTPSLLLPTTSPSLSSREPSLLSPSPPASSRWTSPTSPFAWYEDWVRARFSDDRHVMVTQRELTTIAMQGVASGMAIMGLVFAISRTR